MLQNHLGKRQLLDAISIDHCWEYELSVDTELLRHNHVGVHFCGGLVIVEDGIIDSVFCNQPWYYHGVESCHTSVTLETIKRVRSVCQLVNKRRCSDWRLGRVCQSWNFFTLRAHNNCNA